MASNSNSIHSQIFTSGSNAQGQLGINCDSDSYDCIKSLELESPVKGLAAGANHSLLLVADTIYCCGSNSHGQLGTEKGLGSRLLSWIHYPLDMESISANTRITAGWNSSFIYNTGSKATWCCGDILASSSWNRVKALDGIDISNIASGYMHTLFLSSDGHVYGCGRLHGLVAGKQAVTEPIFLSISSDNEAIVDVAVGMFHSVFLLSTGRILIRGREKHGVLSSHQGSIILDDVPRNVFSGWSSCGTLTLSKILLWGRSDLGQLGCGPIESYSAQLMEGSFPLDINFEKVSFGPEYGLALSNQGTVFAWGWNEHGNCAVGHTNNIHVPELVPLDNVSDLVCGGGHCLLVVEVKAVS
jgi:alpha-tubulin suppressor-like RCC1 family protein